MVSALQKYLFDIDKPGSVRLPGFDVFRRLALQKQYLQ